MVTNPPQIKKVKFPTDYLETLSAKVSIKINKIMKLVWRVLDWGQ